ncbi:MAG: REP-associated tyrosine transposase [Acidobacteriaceae bacterium]|jgi:putative transposase|nr:REP-associated tyrosine transposase [Acidobacteriaceae bacterium]
MTRLRRVVAVNVPHHLTQRGNARQYILDRDQDRGVYLKLLRENIENYEVSLLGFCLMSNHVHLIAVPTLADGLALAFRNAHGRYAAYWNAIHGASGHAWQGRFYSCPLDEAHLWTALRYTELNPVRAGLVSQPELWPWSSAAMHCGKTDATSWLADRLWQNRWTVPAWREYLLAPEAESDVAAIRRSTHTGRPLGDAEFVSELEKTTGRRLIPQKRGRRKGNTPDPRQASLSLDAPPATR